MRVTSHCQLKHSEESGNGVTGAKQRGAGSPQRGAATTFMATLDLIQRAHTIGMNFVVGHEPAFRNEADTVKDLAYDPIYKFKMDFCRRNDMLVWRFHDHIHARKLDLI
jgi:hypothetical protein